MGSPYDVQLDDGPVSVVWLCPQYRGSILFCLFWVTHSVSPVVYKLYLASDSVINTFRILSIIYSYWTRLSSDFYLLRADKTKFLKAEFNNCFVIHFIICNFFFFLASVKYFPSVAESFVLVISVGRLNRVPVAGIYQLHFLWPFYCFQCSFLVLK